MDILDDIDTPP